MALGGSAVCEGAVDELHLRSNCAGSFVDLVRFSSGPAHRPHPLIRSIAALRGLWTMASTPAPSYAPLQTSSDPHDAGDDEGVGLPVVFAAPVEEACSTPRAFANTFLSFVGAGILGLPFAFSRAGMLEAVAVLFTVIQLLLLPHIHPACTSDDAAASPLLLRCGCRSCLSCCCCCCCWCHHSNCMHGGGRVLWRRRVRLAGRCRGGWLVAACAELLPTATAATACRSPIAVPPPTSPLPPPLLLLPHCCCCPTVATNHGPCCSCSAFATS